jgi:ribosomal protein S6
MENKADVEAGEERKRTYELGYLALPTLSDTAVGDLIASFKEIITKNEGVLIFQSAPHMIPLSYPIYKKTGGKNIPFLQAWFGFIHFTGNSNLITLLNEKFSKEDSLIRFIIVKEPRAPRLADEVENNISPELRIPPDLKVDEALLDKEIEGMLTA